MRSHRSVAILVVAVLALVLAPTAIAQQIALQNSGLDEYTEDVPDAGTGEEPVGGDDGSDGDPSDGSSPSSDPGTDPGAVDSGTGTSTSTGTSGAPTEEQVTSGSGSTPDGQLPATGLETVFLALAGAGLLALGLYVRKVATG